MCGIKLPPGLKESEKLPEPILTPATKAERGLHDENIPFGQVCDLVGRQTAEKVKALSLAAYGEARSYAEERGIIICDTKFEWGYIDGRLSLVDEVLTPDSSRFWPVETYEPGRPQPSFDKQYVRDWLEACGWNKQPPVPELSAEVIEKTTDNYMEACRLLTGSVPEV